MKYLKVLNLMCENFIYRLTPIRDGKTELKIFFNEEAIKHILSNKKSRK